MTSVKSPITNGNVELVKTLSKKVILRDYRAKYKVDVSRFFDTISELKIYQCLETGYKFYYPFKLAGDGQFYDAILRGGDYYPDWKKEYEFAKKMIQNNEQKMKVLDVGCGKGVFMSEMKKYTDITGLEFSDNAIDLCNKKGLNVVKDLVEDHAIKNNEKYDVVCAFQVLEHVPKVKEFIDGCLLNLKKGGTLILSVPNNEPYYLGHHFYAISNLPPHHMGLWNLEVFKNLENYFPIKLVKHDFDHDISLTKSFLSSALSKSKNILSTVGNQHIINALGFAIFVVNSPGILYKNLIQRKKVYGRVMVSFTKH